MKKKITISIDDEILDFIHEKLNQKDFASVSHAFEKVMYDFMVKDREGWELP